MKALVTASSTYKAFYTQSFFGSLLFLKFLMQIHLQCLFWLTGDNQNSTFGNLRCVYLLKSRAKLSLSFEWSIQSIIVNDAHNYPPTSLHQQDDFWPGNLFHLVLSEYANQSHNFTDLIFCKITLPLLYKGNIVDIKSYTFKCTGHLISVKTLVKRPVLRETVNIVSYYMAMSQEDRKQTNSRIWLATSILIAV